MITCVERFNNKALVIEPLQNESITLDEYARNEKLEGSKTKKEIGNRYFKMDRLKFIIVTNRFGQKIGECWSDGILMACEDNRKPNFVGRKLKIEFTKEALTGITKEEKAKMICSMFYIAYIKPGYTEKDKKDLEEYCSIFNEALKDSNIKKLRADVIKMTEKHYEVTYTDLRLMILEYYTCAMGMSCVFESTRKYKVNLRNRIVPEILEKTQYGRLVDISRLNRLLH